MRRSDNKGGREKTARRWLITALPQEAKPTRNRAYVSDLGNSSISAHKHEPGATGNIRISARSLNKEELLRNSSGTAEGEKQQQEINGKTGMVEQLRGAGVNLRTDQLLPLLDRESQHSIAQLISSEGEPGRIVAALRDRRSQPVVPAEQQDLRVFLAKHGSVRKFQ